MQDIVFELKGLNCANCAAKIEEEVKKLDGIDSASLTFASQKLSLKLEEGETAEDIHLKVNRIVKNHEPDIEVIYAPEGFTGKPEATGLMGSLTAFGKEIAFLSAGIILFAAGLTAARNTSFELPLFLLAYLICGHEVLLQAGKNIIKGRVFDENFLMGIATIGAFAVGENAEAAGVMIFFQIGELLQDLAVNKSRRSIKALLDLKPAFANLKTEDEIIRIEPEKLKIADTIVIKPGERVPADCVITEGTSYLDTSSLTGESVPRYAEPGSRILGGFINNNGLLYARVDTLLKESAVSRVMELVENAAARKAPIENFITKFAVWYTPIVVALAVLTAIIPPLVSGSMHFRLWIYRALLFLVISCPCALVISVPLTFFAGIGLASSKGILVKGSNYLEALAEADTFVFDKTGTLTKGVFRVTEIKAAEGFDGNTILEVAAIAETHSSHPAAKALLEEYKARFEAGDTVSSFSERISGYEEIAGMGVKAVIDGKAILAGNKKLAADGNIKGDIFEAPMGTEVHVAVDGRYAGLITISDVIKDDAANAVEALRRGGAKNIIMLTGDSKAAANSIARQLKLDSAYSELLPHQKAETLEKLKAASSGKVVFTGDGINDAPVLAMADVGVSMGSIGSDAAIEASDIVLMTDEPSKLANAVAIARRTRKIAWQNIVFALAVKVGVMAIGVTGIASMWDAVFADVGVTLLAVFNSLRILHRSGK